MITVKIEIKYNPVKTGSLVPMLFKLFSLVKLIGINGAKVEVEYFKKHPIQDMDIESIRQTVCNYFKIEESVLDICTRKREVVLGRQVCMYFSKKNTKNSLTTIGRNLGNKDHATVLHAYKTVQNLIDTDKIFKRQINDIEKQLIGKTIKMI